MIKAMVVDDEELTAEHICRLLKNYQTDVLGYYLNPLEALEKVNILKPDVLFLDIEMPEMNGLELAEEIHARGYECEIVFITAYNQYAIEAFSVNALDYLLKPVMEKDIVRSVERVKKRRVADFADKFKSRNKIRVALFGNLSLYVEDDKEPIHWMTAKCAEVFAFMLLHKDEREISKGKFMEAIWIDKDKQKADINLRSTICRLNKTLRENVAGISMISTANGYRLDLKDINLEVEAFELERLAIDSFEVNLENAELFNRIVLNSKDMLLEDVDSQWCEDWRARYHRYFMRAARKLIDYYLSINEEPLKILNIIELMIKHEPYDEDLRELALKLHYRLGSKKGAKKYYEEYGNILKRDLRIEPGEVLQNLYLSIMSQ